MGLVEKQWIGICLDDLLNRYQPISLITASLHETSRMVLPECCIKMTLEITLYRAPDSAR